MLVKLRQFVLKKEFTSSLWVVSEFGFAQVIRLASNLILTRLLIPEYFGIMAVVNSIIAGVIMVTEIGIRESLINNEDGRQPYFTATAWTLQVGRGLLVFFLLMLLAPFFQHYFEIDQLLYLMMFVAAYPLIRSFSTVGIFFTEKEMNMKRPVILSISSQIAGTLAMISMAYYSGSVWSLAFGPVTSAVTFTVLSHFLFPGFACKFHYNKEAAGKIFHFGKWVFLGVGASFIILQSDKIVLAKFISVAELGIYSVALVYGMFVRDLMNAVSMKLLFQKFRMLVQDGNLKKINQIRYMVLVLTTVGLFFLTLISERLIELLYDERYHNAVWMAQGLLFVCLVEAFSITLVPYYLSMKSSFSSMLYQVFKGSVMIPAMIFGVSVGGLQGFIIGLFFAGIIAHVFTLIVAYRLGNKIILIDLAGLTAATFILFGGWALMEATSIDIYFSVFSW